MTISDPFRPGAGPRRRPVGASTVACSVVSSAALALLAACGQKGALRLENDARPAASVPAVVPGSSSRAEPVLRDPFANPSPTALPASVPRP